MLSCMRDLIQFELFSVSHFLSSQLASIRVIIISSTWGANLKGAQN